MMVVFPWGKYVPFENVVWYIDYEPSYPELKIKYNDGSASMLLKSKERGSDDFLRLIMDDLLKEYKDQTKIVYFDFIISERKYTVNKYINDELQEIEHKLAIETNVKEITKLRNRLQEFETKKKIVAKLYQWDYGNEEIENEEKQ